MPQSDLNPPHPDEASGASVGDSTDPRISELEKRTLDYWMQAVTSTAAGSAYLHEIQNSFSWRITAPLRSVRSLQLKASRVGYRNAVVIGLARARRIRSDRAHGK